MSKQRPALTDKSQQELREFQFKRLLVGLLSLSCLIIAGLIYATSPAAAQSPALAICVRVGLVLGAIWLALPQLRPVLDRLPLVFVAVVLVMMIIIAARPNLFRIVGSLVVIVGALMGISKWITRMTRKS